MRIFKFRVWSTIKKQFIQSGFHIIGETTLFNLLNAHSIEDLNSLKVMQFVGITDINEQDIYEGDIIHYYEKMDDHSDINDYIAEVFYDSKDACFYLGRNRKHWNSFRDSTISQLKVIGNIFENRELLCNNITHKME